MLQLLPVNEYPMNTWQMRAKNFGSAHLCWHFVTRLHLQTSCVLEADSSWALEWNRCGQGVQPAYIRTALATTKSELCHSTRKGSSHEPKMSNLKAEGIPSVGGPVGGWGRCGWVWVGTADKN